MDHGTAARVRTAQRIRLLAGVIVIVVGLLFAFGNPWFFGHQNTTMEIVIGLLMVAAGVLNIVRSLFLLGKLPRG
jgi:uncharacterized membrane protein HdeD (DUF308 family)